LEQPFLSLVIPAYNEEQRLPGTLKQVFAFLQAQPYTFEVVIVENGSQDRTLQVAQEYASRYPQLCVMSEPSRGKGGAVRAGMLAALGKYRFMCDADLSMPIAEINRFLPPVLSDFDIAIASREAPGAVRYNEPAYRHLVGRVFNLMIRVLALPGLNDTQCGFKCFRGELVEDVFRRQTISGWSFDIEVLFIARQRGYHIVEMPIPWYYTQDSKVQVLRDSLKMGLDLIKIRLNALRGVYAQPL
jgi:glycosyltransferase involved in cell wall biosynthesis